MNPHFFCSIIDVSITPKMRIVKICCNICHKPYKAFLRIPFGLETFAFFMPHLGQTYICKIKSKPPFNNYNKNITLSQLFIQQAHTKSLLYGSVAGATGRRMADTVALFGLQWMRTAGLLCSDGFVLRASL